MASNPPAHCCTVGVRHEGEAKGEIKKIGESQYILFTVMSKDGKRKG